MRLFAPLLRFLLPGLLLVLRLALPATAQPKAGPPNARIKVYLVGTFHFDGSSSDVNKGSKTNMKEAKKQQELDDIIRRLARTKADKVFVEWQLRDQRFVDSTYALYRQNKFTLGNNEVYQLGYRLARRLDRPRVYCADAPGVFDYDAALTYAKAHGQEKLLASSADKPEPDSLGRLMEARVGHRIGIGPDELRDPPGETLVGKLARYNSARFARANMDWYLLIGARVGGGGNYSGADLAGEFYKRNMRIYTNLLRAVDVRNDKAIVLIIGAGHVSFLREQLQHNSLFEVQDVGPLLSGK